MPQVKFALLTIDKPSAVQPEDPVIRFNDQTYLIQKNIKDIVLGEGRGPTGKAPFRVQ